MIHAFSGEFLTNPSPLELVLHRCNYGCAYCFSTLNYRHRGFTHTNIQSTINLIQTHQERDTLTAQLMQMKYPITFSNHTDPFCPANEELTFPILDMLTAYDLPVAFQTKGGKRAKDAVDHVNPSIWYITLTTDQPDLKKRMEPGAPTIEDVFDLIAHLRAHDHCVMVGVNPYVSGWIADEEAFCRRLKEAGVWGIWTEHFHLNYRQRDQLLPKERAALGEEMIALAMKRKKPAEWCSAFENFRAIAFDAGLQVYSGGYHEYSEYFDPYYLYYPNIFPMLQDFTNICHEEQRQPTDLISEQEFQEYCAFFLPDGVFKGMSSYIGAVSHDTWWKHTVPDAMTYRDLIHLIWHDLGIANSPVNSSAFAYACESAGTDPDGTRLWIPLEDDAHQCRLLTFQAQGCNSFYVGLNPADCHYRG